MERLRRALTSDLIHLNSLQPNLHHTQSTAMDHEEDPHTESFDDLDDEVDADSSQPDQLPDAGDPDNPAIPPKRRPLHLPSSHSTPSDHPLYKAELTLRVKQATRYLTTLRDAIADKSFQYSHVMRLAPSKAMRTRSRSAIKNISDRIAQYSRVYSRARAAMVRLGADESTLNRFRLLRSEDIKASTAILDPNIPGASTLRLSWIWQTGPRNSGSASDNMQECKSLSCLDICISIDFPRVQRVHWIRARSQKNRWEEELLLVKYEMEWTTRSFLHKAKVWQDRFEELNVGPGPKAYAARQSSQWRCMASEADRLFRSTNPEYTCLTT